MVGTTLCCGSGGRLWTLATRHNLAYWRGEAGDPAGAAAALEPLLADARRALGPEHPDTLNARHNLANWRGQASQLRHGPNS